MGEFFSGWRRKVGCITLVVVAVLTAAWLRSLTFDDEFFFTVGDRRHRLRSVSEQFSWAAWPNNEATLLGFHWRSQRIDDVPDIIMVSYIMGCELPPVRSIVQWALPYGCMTAPLILLSGYLLLSKSKASPGKEVTIESSALL